MTNEPQSCCTLEKYTHKTNKEKSVSYEIRQVMHNSICSCSYSVQFKRMNIQNKMKTAHQKSDGHHLVESF